MVSRSAAKNCLDRPIHLFALKKVVLFQSEGNKDSINKGGNMDSQMNTEEFQNNTDVI